MLTSASNKTESRRREVLEAAAECFRSSGFHQASMARIARDAGMSPGHLYNLFENKDDIIRAIVVRDQNQRLEFIDALERAPDVSQAILDALPTSVERTLAMPGAALRLEVLAEAGRNPKLAAVVQAADASRRQSMRGLLKVAHAQRGTDPGDQALHEQATALAMVFDALIVRAVRDPGMDQASLVKVVHRLIQAVVLA